MGIIAWIVLGALAGFIANLIMGGGDGLIMMIVLGIVGAVVGGFIAGSVLGIADVTGFNLQSLVVAVFGAIVVIFVARLFMGRGSRPDRLMADQHAKGAVSTVKGTVNEGVGKLTGDKKLETKGKVQKVQGKAQDGLGDVQDAAQQGRARLTSRESQRRRGANQCEPPLLVLWAHATSRRARPPTPMS